MLISINDLIEKYGLKINGVVHLGAHLLEEKCAYENAKISNVAWVEGNPDIYQKGLEILAGFNGNHRLFNYLITDKDDDEVVFHVANNGQSSSILALGKHKEYHPDIKYIDQKVLKSKTMRWIIEENNIDLKTYNFLNIDLQGAELLALKSFGELLKHFDYIYTEVNVGAVYINNPLLKDIDAYLLQYGFHRLELQMVDKAEWGDAFYSKKVGLKTYLNIFLYKIKFHIRLYLNRLKN